LNETTGAYPGSVHTRFSNRKPQTLSYAALSPVLLDNPGHGDLVRMSANQAFPADRRTKPKD
jgi:cytochrome c peroxidase